MNHYVFTDHATTFTRISKREAKQLFSEKRSFYIIAHKMRPGFPFSLGMMIDGTRYLDENVSFDSMLNNFCYYNANCHETGLYAAFYATSERRNHSDHCGLAVRQLLKSPSVNSSPNPPATGCGMAKPAQTYQQATDEEIMQRAKEVL